MKKIYCFGNEFIEEDSLGKKIVENLKIDGFEFVKCETPDEILYIKDDLIILDVVKDLKKAAIISDINRLKKKENLISLHDFDLAGYLQLLHELGNIRKIIIIGIPQKGNIEEIKTDLLRLLPVDF